MKYILPMPGVVLVLVACVICIGMETCAYQNFEVWQGNVTVTGISDCDGEACLGFNYGPDDKHGYVKSGYIVKRYADKDLPWLWCEVSRSGAGICLPPQDKYHAH